MYWNEFICKRIKHTILLTTAIMILYLPDFLEIIFVYIYTNIYIRLGGPLYYVGNKGSTWYLSMHSYR